MHAIERVNPKAVPPTSVGDSQNGATFDRVIDEILHIFEGADEDQFDNAVRRALKSIVCFGQVDCAAVSLAHCDEDLRVTQSWSRGCTCVITEGLIWQPVIPHALGVILAGETFAFSSPDELTKSEQAIDRLTFLDMREKSHLSMPIENQGSVIGALTIVMARNSRPFSPSFIDRFRTITHLFAGAIYRHQTRIHVGELQGAKAQLARVVGPSSVGSSPDLIIGESVGMRRVRATISEVASSDASILIEGETGTGKELVARAIHRQSQRASKPLVVVNCAVLHGDLIHSELFGHERGAFTGAADRAIGRFEIADGGTVFLDEISDLPVALQGKLLRVLQEGEFERLGSTKMRKVDVRVIAATNRDLRADMQSGKFRNDLYYRLCVVPIVIPPLRKRREDIPALVWHFVRLHQLKLGKTIRRIPHELVVSLMAYDWPGNVRELSNVIERAVLVPYGDALKMPEPLDQTTLEESSIERLDVFERAHIIKVLDKSGWKVKGDGNAADRLGLNPSTLRSRMKALGILRDTEQVARM